jgi:hypothetical protein
MQLKSLIPCCLLALVAAAAMRADTIALTFEGLTDQEAIDNYYNGGKGSKGSGPGPNYGITFGSDSLAIVSQAKGGGGNFDGAPSGKTIAFFLTGSGDVMNVASGFTTGFSFYYSAPNHPGSVSVYSGQNGTGSILATLNLPLTPDGTSSPTPKTCSGDYNYCPWEPFGVTFDGTAQSVVFSGTANYIGFDNITLGSSTPVVGDSPEPASYALLASGLGMVAWLGSRLRRTNN